MNRIPLSVAAVCLFTSSMKAATADFGLRAESAVQISFQTTVGNGYILESSPDVPTPTWTAEGSMISGAGQRHVVNFLTDQSGQRIYRVTEVPMAAGLVAYYPFNGTANDAIGSNHGVVTDAVLVADRKGNANEAYSFNGTSAWITLPDQGLPSGNGPRTVALWIHFNGYSANPALISYGAIAPNNAFYAVLLSASRPNNPLCVGQAGGGDTPSVAGTELNRWYHLTFSHDGSQTKIFLDGVLRGTASRTFDTTLPGTWHIGSYIDPAPTQGNVHHHGLIDDVRVYNRALTDAEILSLGSAR
jgi:hypothetical protein